MTTTNALPSKVLIAGFRNRYVTYRLIAVSGLTIDYKTKNSYPDSCVTLFTCLVAERLSYVLSMHFHTHWRLCTKRRFSRLMFACIVFACIFANLPSKLTFHRLLQFTEQFMHFRFMLNVVTMKEDFAYFYYTSQSYRTTIRVFLSFQTVLFAMLNQPCLFIYWI